MFEIIEAGNTLRKTFIKAVQWKTEKMKTDTSLNKKIKTDY